MRLLAGPLPNRVGLIALSLALVFLALQTVDLSARAASPAGAPPQLLTLAGSPPAAPAAPANGDTVFLGTWGDIINAPGTYALSQTITGTQGVGLYITSDSVTLVGNGFSILGDGAPEGGNTETGVYLPPGTSLSHSNVQIVNVNFSGLENGVFIQNAPTSADSVMLIANNTFVDNQFGIYVANTGEVWRLAIVDNVFIDGQSGIQVNNPGTADSLQVSGNSFTNIVLPSGLTNDGTATGLDIAGNDRLTFQLLNSGDVSRLRLNSNTMDTQSFGIQLQNSGGTASSLDVTGNDRLVFFALNNGDLIGLNVSDNQFHAGSSRLVLINQDSVAGLNVTANDALVLNLSNSGSLTGANIAHNNFDTLSFGRAMDLQNQDDIVGLTFTDNSVFAPVQVLHTGVVIADLDVTNNYFENTSDYAVTFWVTPTVPVGTLNLGFESNTVNAPSGLFIVDGPVQDSVATLSGVSIRDNTFTGGFEPLGYTNPVGYVTLIGGGENIYIVNNLMDGGSVPGLYLRSWFTPEAAADHPFQNVYIESNTIQNLNGSDGVVLEKYFGDSAGLSQSLAPSAPGVLSIRNNSLVNNDGVGILLVPPDAGPTTIDARWNWWGDALGPNGPSGDGVGAGVIFDPWLGEPPGGGGPNRIYMPLISR